MIDGDEVRKLVSPELGYSSGERTQQLNRVLGIALIAKSNGLFPIISTVTMIYSTLITCQANNFEVVEITRPYHQLKKVRAFYENGENLVGTHIKLPKLKTVKINNNGDEKFSVQLMDLMYRSYNFPFKNL